MVGALAEGDAGDLEFLGLLNEVPDETVDFLRLLFGFVREMRPGPVFSHIGIMIGFGLLDYIREFD